MPRFFQRGIIPPTNMTAFRRLYRGSHPTNPNPNPNRMSNNNNNDNINNNVTLTPSVVSYNKHLNSLVSRRKIDEAFTFFQDKMLSEKLLDTCSFNILIKGLCRAGRVDRAFHLFTDMTKSRSRSSSRNNKFKHRNRNSNDSVFGEELFLCPDIITYNSMIDGLCRVNEVDKAYELLLDVVGVGGGGVRADVVTYTSVIKGFCRGGRMSEAWEVFERMVKDGVRPSLVTFNVVIDGFGKVGDVESGEKVYERMLLVGCCPDVVTFTCRIDGYARVGKVEEVLRLWEEMVRRRLCPNEYTFSIVVLVLCKESRVSEACDFLEQLDVWKGIVPRAFMFNPVIDGLCKAGDIDRANFVVSDMERRGCALDKYTFTILIIGHCMKGRMMEAIGIFHKMLAVQCTPDDITTKSLISCLVKAGMPSEASLVKKHLALGLGKVESVPSGRYVDGIRVAA